MNRRNFIGSLLALTVAPDAIEQLSKKPDSLLSNKYVPIRRIQWNWPPIDPPNPMWEEWLEYLRKHEEQQHGVMIGTLSSSK